MIIAAGVVVVGIGERQHENDGVFGFDERSDFAEFHATLQSLAFPSALAGGAFDDCRLCQFSSKAIRHGASVLWFS